MSKSPSVFVIVNHAAARAREAWPRVRDALARAGVEFDAHESARPGETEERTRTALVEGFETVAVVGGDGTLSASANGYFEPLAQLSPDEWPRAVNPDAALAILPAGTGDDFARGLAGGKRQTLEAWLARLIEHCRRADENVNELSDEKVSEVVDESVAEIDESAAGSHQSSAERSRSATTRRVDALLGSADGGSRRFVCLNAATLGLGAEVAGRVAAQGAFARRLSGEARFAWAALRSLAAWRVARARVMVDGAMWVEGELNLVVVANGPSAGGGMNFAPEASVRDGLLDVLTVCGISRAGLLRELARVRVGGHLHNPKVKLTRGTHVRAETLNSSDSLAIEADGDVRGHTPAEFRVLAGALRVVC
jgi:diacylglycerol kinase family enzyme